MHVQSANIRFTYAHQFERNEQQTTAVVEQGRLVQELPRTATTASPESIQLRLNATPNQYGPPSGPTLTRPVVARDIVPSNTVLSSTVPSDIETSLLKALVEAMTGKKIETENIVQQSNNTPATTLDPALNNASLNQTAKSPQRTALNLTLVNEYEYSQVAITANLTGSNNEQLDIQLSVVMERRYTESSMDVLRQEGVITDPLIINFNGATANLSSRLVEFDLNSDGENEWIPNLVSNSAYIAMDRNNDGVINNGSELFGPDTGNGFGELAQFDDDQNGFIDNNDKVFSQLLAFNPNSDTLQTLDNLGVDILYLGSVDSPFRLTNHNNQTLGEIRATGFYVDENGLASSLQQVDLIV